MILEIKDLKKNFKRYQFSLISFFMNILNSLYDSNLEWILFKSY
jgi:hypothetical protein